MLKNLTQIETKIGDKLYHLSCDQDAPIEQVKEALFQFLKYVGRIEDAIKAQQEAQAEKEKAEEKSEKVTPIESAV